MDVGDVAGALRWWAVLVAAGSMFVLGGAWYGGLIAGRWQALVGLSDDEVAQGSGRVFAIAGACSLVIAAVMALFVGHQAGVSTGATAGMLAGLGWVAPALAMTFAFERRPAALAAIDAGYHVVAFTLSGAILGALA